jgi:hypothetical protein
VKCVIALIFGTTAAWAAGLTRVELEKIMPKEDLLFLSAPVYHAKAPQAVEIQADVTGLKEVTLITWTAGDGGSDADYADWLDARFEGEGAAVYLSDVPWEFAWTLCGTQWRCPTFVKTDVRKNLSALDTPLASQGRLYRKGLGVMSPSMVVYAVPDGARALKACGVVDDIVLTFPTAKSASVQFLVVAGTPAAGLVSKLDLPQILPAGKRALVAALKGRCDDLRVREYAALWRSLLLEERVYGESATREQRAGQALSPQASVHKSDRDPLDILLRRTAALLNDLAERTNLKREAAELAELQAAADAVAPENGEVRAELFIKLCRLQRRIAFKNPLLAEIDKLLFITREALPPEEMHCGNHMADQFFGFNATVGGTAAGGGLYVLDNPFTDRATVRNLLKDSVVEAGAMKGRRLGDGGYLAPEVSYDGSQVLFAYTRGVHGERAWTEDSVFHIFRCNADGSGLVQLTDGCVNDLDPCWLPNGRIAFISERRGGYGRCHGRPVPSFTLHTMFEDGTDITMLSPHETNEWQPSVDHNGMIVYTRWDYVDRGHNQAHHAWTTYPDGRDSRPVNGNNHDSQRTAPMMQMDLRAVPGSRKYAAIATGHHCEARGSVILIDPALADDNKMSQIKRVTPDQLFPETEYYIDCGSAAYASPWPLSEKYYLCVYDGFANAQYGPIDWKARRYELTLLDAFGNKIPLFRHPEISCLSPMPLHPRPMPPVLPHRTLVGRPRLPNGEKPEVIPPEQLPKFAEVGVINVYNSRYPMPEGVKIRALRVWQVLPKSTPLADNPRIGMGSQKGAKLVLGTVPVEEDGSAYWKQPVGVPVLFHALDEEGKAVQGMRSVTYTAPGETLMCNGCHEQRLGVRQKRSSGMPLAMRRAPSRIKPEVSGSNPYSFPRLVQPLLDRHCIGCHGAGRKQGMPDLRRGEYHKDPDLFFASIRSLQKHVFHYGAYHNFIEFEEPSTIPGRFGAYASPLYTMLTGGHHDVKLSAEEMRRILLFIESNASFLGHDHDARAQADGWIVYPILQ